MCGRFAFHSPREAVLEYFGLELPADAAPSYNIAPSQSVAVLRAGAGDEDEIALLKWGLVPSWAKDPAVGNRMINARAETVAEKPAFRAAWKRRRCGILADGFYEWQTMPDGPKQPWFIRPVSNGPFLMAGLWEHWEKGPEPLQTCTIITTAASQTMQAVHHRMPVILGPESLETWLHGEDPAAAAAILEQPGPALQMHGVSRFVNSPANNGPDLILPAST